MQRRTMLLVALLLILAAWLGYDHWRIADDEAVITCAAVEEPEKAQTFVYVTGAVRKPGLYAFDEAPRVAEAIKTAGDALPYADMAALDGAGRAEDGMHIHVPYDLEGVPTMPEDANHVNLNTADEKKLMELPGVGAATAKAILSYRQEHGSFSAPEEVQQVKGIGPAKWEKMKDKVTL